MGKTERYKTCGNRDKEESDSVPSETKHVASAWSCRFIAGEFCLRGGSRAQTVQVFIFLAVGSDLIVRSTKNAESRLLTR